MVSEESKRGEVTAVATGAVAGKILVIRGLQVMLDEDLAGLYGVETKALTRTVRRNAERFPSDFMFQLSKEEFASLRSQIGASNDGRGGRRYAPLAFTEQGVAMLSSVLRSHRAVTVNIEIMRVFVQIRRAAANFEEIEKRIGDLEEKTDGRLAEHEKHLVAIFKVLKEMAAPPPEEKRPVGFAAALSDEN